MKKIIFILVPVLVVMMMAGCIPTKTKHQSVQYTEEDAIPYRIAILPAQYMTHSENSTVHKSILIVDDDRTFVADIARSAIYNQLAGKGYLPLQKSVVDNGLSGLGKDSDWKTMSSEELCKILNADGIVRINISSADMITAVAFDLFQLDAEVEIVNSADKLVGKWSESASKRRVSVPTGLFSLAGTILEEVFSDPARRQMRMVIYDWAWNLAQMLPDCPKGPKLPQVVSVDTNVDNKLFGVGKRIAVRVDAEPGLKCSFDIGEFKKNIPLSQTSEGIYEGFYVVHEGDKGVDETLLIRMRKSNGIERLWVEAGSLVTVDGQLPPVPEFVTGRAGKEGVELTWEVPTALDLEDFVIEKGIDPVGLFEVVGRTQGVSFLDSEVLQGGTVYYRVRTMDRAGNLSASDGLLKVVVPQFDERELFGELRGVLVKGNYLIKFPVSVPQGASFTILPGTKIKFSDGSRMDVAGELKSLGEIRSPVKFESANTEGIKVLSGGSAVLSLCDFSGFSRAVTNGGGYSEIRSSSFSGGGGSEFAVKVSKMGRYDFTGLRVSGVKIGIILSSGNGSVVRSSISNCTTGLEFNGGNSNIRENNIFDNDINILSRSKLVVEENYFGTASSDKMKVKGDVLVKSILDAPYPHGRKIVLIDDKTITPKLLEERFSKLKAEGVLSFHNQQYGDAYQKLEQALKLKDDRDIFLYLSYTLLALGDDVRLTEVLSEGLSKFPYDVRLHQLYVRRLLNKGEIGQARQVLERALTLSPTDSSLLYMKDYLDHIGGKKGAEKSDEK
ncbi:hypothetical protein [Maridesulfovibrio ferrireducens]|uniref:hypothetical protein n=1 Tax=Maridesulfovibrio ferrireducens TaxID=246191 RepID=UPI001A27DE84|nr:hypothetical protein [Maridesulfovibrio ferrireducens]MBI9112795.1 hypothetical protein [Maridesulfovibrio ferrireducens]